MLEEKFRKVIEDLKVSETRIPDELDDSRFELADAMDEISSLRQKDAQQEARIKRQDATIRKQRMLVACAMIGALAAGVMCLD